MSGTIEFRHWPDRTVDLNLSDTDQFPMGEWCPIPYSGFWIKVVDYGDCHILIKHEDDIEYDEETGRYEPSQH